MKHEEIIHKDGCTETVAAVGSRYGINSRFAYEIVKYVRSCEREVVMIRVDDWIEVDGSSIMGVLTLEGYCGVRIGIRVEGTDEKAEEITRDLYELISSYGVYD